MTDMTQPSHAVLGDDDANLGKLHGVEPVHEVGERERAACEAARLVVAAKPSCPLSLVEAEVCCLNFQ